MDSKKMDVAETRFASVIKPCDRLQNKQKNNFNE